MNQNYTFGDNERAARRLELLARVFEPTTRVLLVRALGLLPRRPRRVLDVGCGPGRTTELLAEVIQPENLIGIDNSPRYVERARQGCPTATFFEHDVMKPGYPGAPYDLIYCRHLLTHLPDVPRALAALSGALGKGGVLVLEETAELSSDDATFARYYEIVAALQANYQQRLDIGRSLAEQAGQAELAVCFRAVTPTAVDPMSMAQLHAMNIATWSRDAFVAGNFERSEIERLEFELKAVADGVRAAPPVRVRVGQVVARGHLD